MARMSAVVLMPFYQKALHRAVFIEDFLPRGPELLDAADYQSANPFFGPSLWV